MEILHLDQSSVLAQLPVRNKESHKGDYGRCLLLCGSVGYTGAPALAAMGALRTGAGLVYVAVPESIYQIEAIKLLEPIVLPLPDKDGMFSSSATKQLAQMLPKMDAVLIGPGIGQSEGVKAVVEFVLENFSGPVVVDADGINVLKLNKDILRGRNYPTIVTPHMGEFSRLGGNVDEDRVEAAVQLARDLNVIVVLKGHRTVITDGQTCYQNFTGNPGMAVGGSGDVLAGVISSLLGQKLSPINAAACGAWLHGAAADLCAKEIGEYGMLPGDYVDYLPRLMR